MKACVYQYGISSETGQGKVAGELVRISLMGEISDYDMARLEQALQVVIAG